MLVNLHVYDIKQPSVLFCKVECVFCTPFSLEETKPGCPKYWWEEANGSVARRECAGIYLQSLPWDGSLMDWLLGPPDRNGNKELMFVENHVPSWEGMLWICFFLHKFSNASSLPNQFNTGVKGHNTHLLPVVAVHVYFEGHLDIKIGYWSNSRHLLEALFMCTSKETVFWITHANLSFQGAIRFG